MAASSKFAAIQGIRLRQRALTRAVLALFCLAWLQVAALPCVMAHDSVASATHHCGDCPWHSGETPSCDDAGQCSYPHSPQVDARCVVAGFLPVLAGPVALLPVQYPARPSSGTAARAPDIPRPSVPIVHCRFLK